MILKVYFTASTRMMCFTAFQYILADQQSTMQGFMQIDNRQVGTLSALLFMTQIFCVIALLIIFKSITACISEAEKVSV